MERLPPDDGDDKQRQRRTSTKLLTKIYYPDTLYPDGCTFFANRADRSTPLTDNQDQTPITTTNQTTRPVLIQTESVSKQSKIEMDRIERQHQPMAPMLDRERGESEPEHDRFNFKRYFPKALRPQDKSQAPVGLLDPRFYSMKKTAMTLLCLLIIIMSNSVQLKHVFSASQTQSFYGVQVFFGFISILMCTIIGVVLMYVMRIDINDQYKQRKLDYIDNIVVCALFVLIIINVFITASS